MPCSFIAWQNDQIEAKVQRDLDYVVGAILRTVGVQSLAAVLLVGGFGRGQGGVLWNGERAEILNDYDLLLVVNPMPLARRLSLTWRINELSIQLAHELGLKLVDLGVVDRNRLPKLENRIFTYECRWGSKVLWGDPAVLSEIPPFSAKEIPLEDGARLLMNRGGGLLIAYQYLLRNEPRRFANYERRNFHIELNKAALAVGDAQLLLAGKYHWSYLERAKLLRDLGEAQPLAEAYEAAVIQKVFPKPEFYEELPSIDLWRKATSDYEASYRKFELTRLHRWNGDWFTYHQFAGTSSRAGFVVSAFRNLAKWGWRRSLVHPMDVLSDWDRKLLLALPALLFSLANGQDNLLALAAEQIQSQRGVEQIIKRYLSLWHG